MLCNFYILIDLLRFYIFPRSKGLKSEHTQCLFITENIIINITTNKLYTVFNTNLYLCFKKVNSYLLSEY